jgi:hypothetical protein
MRIRWVEDIACKETLDGGSEDRLGGLGVDDVGSYGNKV